MSDKLPSPGAGYLLVKSAVSRLILDFLTQRSDIKVKYFHIVLSVAIALNYVRSFTRRAVSSRKGSMSPVHPCSLVRTIVTGWFAAYGQSCDNFGMDAPQQIALDDVVLREDLDPRLGQRDDDLIAQYADIFDALPPIEINQKNELIHGWLRGRD